MKKYNSIRKFSSVEAANNFLISHPQYGVLSEIKRDTIYINKQIEIRVAKITDLGN